MDYSFKRKRTIIIISVYYRHSNKNSNDIFNIKNVDATI